MKKTHIVVWSRKFNLWAVRENTFLNKKFKLVKFIGSEEECNKVILKLNN